LARNPPTRKYRKRKSGRDPVLPAFRAGQALRIRQVRSGIDRPPGIQRTLEALGLKHHQDVVTHKDHPAIRGMLYKVRHLVKVAPAKEGDR